MKIGAGPKGLLVMAPTVGLFVVLVLGALHSRATDHRTEELISQARRSSLVESLRVALVTASDAERSAVLAVTDEDSQTFAAQTLAAIAQVEHLRDELAPLLATGAQAHGKESLERFTKAFEEFRKLDADILSLAVKNTNLKAYSLAFGPAAQAATEIDTALSHLANQATTPREALLAASRALIGVLRIQALLAPHIAEESDSKMDALEAVMSKEDKEIRQRFDDLYSLALLRNDTDLAAARSSYARFDELRARILKLSRENTNVHSLALTLDQNRSRAMSSCQDALTALRQAIVVEEPAPHEPVRPR